MHRSVDLRLPRDISSQNLVSFAFITTQISNRQLLNMDTRSKARGFITWHLMCNFEGYTSKGLFRGLVLRFWKFPQIEEPAVEVYGKRGLCSTTVTSVSFCTRLGTHLYKNNVTRTKTWEANYAAMSPKTARTHTTVVIARNAWVWGDRETTNIQRGPEAIWTRLIFWYTLIQTVWARDFISSLAGRQKENSCKLEFHRKQIPSLWRL